MDAGNMGYGAGGGILSAILVWAGFKQRLDKMEHDFEEHKKAVMYKDTHEVCISGTRRAYDDMNKKLDLILEKLGR